MQYGMMEVVGASRASGLRGLGEPPRIGGDRLSPIDVDISVRTMPVGAGIMVHKGAQVYDGTEGAWFTLTEDTPAQVGDPGEPSRYIIGDSYTDESGSTRVLKVTKNQWAVTWAAPAYLSNPTYPDVFIRAAGQQNMIGPATAFHEELLVNGAGNGAGNGEPRPDGMSTGTKVAIGVGIAAGALLVVWLLTRK